MIRDVRHAVPTLALAFLAAGAAATPQAESPAGAPRSARPATVAAKRAVRPRAALPPLDRELFFGNPEIAAAQISADGQYIAFLKPWQDTRNIYVKKTGEPFAKARLLTTETKRPIPGFFWSRDSRLILYVKDNDGDENYNVWAVDPAAPNAEGKEAPASRNLTDLKGVRTMIYSLPKKTPDLMYVGLNDRDAAWHDLYRVSISTGKRELLRKNTERIADWFFDLQGQLRLAVRIADNGDTEILRVDPEAFTKVYSCSVFEGCGPERFHKDGRRVYMQTNKGDADLSRLVLFDPANGQLEPVESDPLQRVDFGGAVFSEATEELIATSYEDERTRIYFKDAGWKADYARLQAKFPGKDVNLGSMTSDDRLCLITASSDSEPGERYLFDRKTKALTFQYKVRERIPRPQMARMKAVRYASRDGLVIPAFLTLPVGVAAKNLPTIVVPHGGPWARDAWGFNNLAQFLANRGYAVLQPNFRGSTGYGKRFLNAGNNEWGDKMQDDVTWGVKYLVAQGIADPKRVGIMGGSYGGYTTLAGVAFTPELYAAAVDIVGPSNLITLLESIPPYWESARTIFQKRLGDLTTAEGRAKLERQSPLNSAQKIKTPLLVAQGANDPRCKRAEAEQIVIALRDRGFPVEYLLAPDEGHGFVRPVNSMSLWAATEKFFARHLGGRFQETMTPEVTKRLAEITVDPKTVVLSKKVDAKAVGAPRPTGTLAPGVTSYKGTLAAGGQSHDLRLTRTVKENGDTWIVNDSVTLPMGEAKDTTTLDKTTLVVRKRSIEQGPVKIELAFDGGKATGTFAMGSGPAKPIAIDLGGELFADGAGADAVLALLPLAEGYTVSFRNLDLMRQKVALKQLKVVAQEDVKVAAGAFKTWKAEITSTEGDPGQVTLWIATDTHKAVKSSATAPMGGALITTELQP